MATTTRILDANVNGTVYTSNANAALEALDTCHSGATAPTDEVANGKLWLDTTTTPGILKIYNNATWEVVHSGTVDINGGTIDGTVIGGATPTDITGTTLTATGAFTSLGIDDNAASTAVTIDAIGNVGIGTSSPNVMFEVVNNTTNLARMRVSTTSTTAGNYRGYEFARGSSFKGGLLQDQSTDAISIFTPIGGQSVTIDSSGNVGIGTTSPDKPLEVVATNTAMKISGVGFSSTGLLFETNGVERKKIGIPSGSSDLAFYSDAGSSEAMRIDASGSVIVGSDYYQGSSTAGAASTYIGSNGFISANVTDDYGMQVNRTGTDGAAVNFRKGGVDVGTISVTTSATAYNTSSDYRLKENITPIQGAADIVKAMRPVTYNFKADSTDWHDGFLAHELQELHPRAVTGEKDAMKDEEYEVTPAVYEDVIIPAVEAVEEFPAVYDEEGVLVSEMVPAVEAQPERTEQQLVSEAVMGTRSVPDYQGVDYSKLTPILTAALQELSLIHI